MSLSMCTHPRYCHSANVGLDKAQQRSLGDRTATTDQKSISAIGRPGYITSSMGASHRLLRFHASRPYGPSTFAGLALRVANEGLSVIQANAVEWRSQCERQPKNLPSHL